MQILPIQGPQLNASSPNPLTINSYNDAENLYNNYLINPASTPSDVQQLREQLIFILLQINQTKGVVA